MRYLGGGVGHYHVTLPDDGFEEQVPLPDEEPVDFIAAPSRQPAVNNGSASDSNSEDGSAIDDNSEDDNDEGSEGASDGGFIGPDDAEGGFVDVEDEEGYAQL